MAALHAAIPCYRRRSDKQVNMGIIRKDCSYPLLHLLPMRVQLILSQQEQWSGKDAAFFSNRCFEIKSKGAKNSPSQKGDSLTGVIFLLRFSTTLVTSPSFFLASKAPPWTSFFSEFFSRERGSKERQSRRR